MNMYIIKIIMHIDIFYPPFKIDITLPGFPHTTSNAQHLESSMQPLSPYFPFTFLQATLCPNVLHLVAKSDGNWVGPYIL